MAKHRFDRMNEEVKRELSEIIRELKDPRLSTMISVVDVEVTKDLRHAKAFISVLGDEEAQIHAMTGLKSAAGFIRKAIGERINLRNTPEFHFELDLSIAHGAHINELLEQMHRNEGPSK
ncbi:MAG: 30S ribosome-binding factor RbfA [Hyphomonadaceae bacterium]|nr:30S ribosome-binding factor RbfA [Clostridia bacterium]